MSLSGTSSSVNLMVNGLVYIVVSSMVSSTSMTEIAPPEAFGYVQGLAMRVAKEIQQRFVIEAHRIDCKRIGLPLANRVTQPQGLRIDWRFAAIGVNLAEVPISLVQNHD